MIRGVLFDYGGVVAEGGKGIELARQVASELGMSENEAIEIILPLWRESTRGLLTDHDFWQRLAEHIGRVIPEDQQHSWDKWWNTHLYPEMARAVETLKSHGYPVGLLSNIVPSAAQAIRAAGGYDPFNFVILSFEVGYAKPDPEIYQLAMAEFKDLKPDEIIFVDDQQKCLPPAETMGMQTILATSPEQVIAELQKLGLPI